ncbi:P-loop containing nucleoside triphosphatehydrolases superfamily protein, partial [Striga asiatica]
MFLLRLTHRHLKCNKFAKFTKDLPTLCPRILLSGNLKDIEKLIAGNPKAYVALKVKLESIRENVVVIIASHSQPKGKKYSHPGGLLFTKFGSNQIALIDLAFPVMKKFGIDCPAMETLSIKDISLAIESTEKIIGWALSHHSMQCSEATLKESKFVISINSHGVNILQAIQNENRSVKKSLK